MVATIWSPSAYTNANVAYVSSIASLRSQTIAMPVVYVSGYYDGSAVGGGLFWYSALDKTTVDNGGTVIVDAAGNRYYADNSSEPLSILRFGAVADGVTNSTNAIQAAVATGKDVYFPSGSYYITSAINAALDFQKLFGSGKLTVAAQVASVIGVVNKTGVVIDGLQLVAGGPYAAGNTYNGVLLQGSTDCVVENCRISNHSGAGVYMMNVTGCTASENKFLAMATDSRWGSPSGSDILISNNADRCVVVGNDCKSAGGFGIQVQTVNPGDVVSNNTIERNNVNGYNSYGIVIYNLNAAGTMLNNKIIGNNVQNISGNRPNTPGGNDKVFGCCIYNQAAEGTLIENNEVLYAGSGTNQELLAPGAIGFANTGVGTCKGNRISNASQYGVYVNDALALGAAGNILIDGNIITSCAQSGIKINQKTGIKITNNEIYNSSVYGIQVINYAALFCYYVDVINNKVRNSTNSAISITGAIQFKVDINDINVSAVNGIGIGASTDGTINGNNIFGCGVRGISVDADVAGHVSAKDNLIKNNYVGVLLLAPIYMDINTVTGNTNVDWAGAYAPWQPLNGTTTPDVKARNSVTSVAGSLITITNFLNGITDQEITIQMQDNNTIIQNNANIILQGAINWHPTANCVLRLRKTVGAWTEICRKT